MIVVYNKPGILNLDGIILMGGANTVDSAKFALWAKHPTIMALHEEGLLEYTIGKAEKKDDLDENHLSEMKPKDAMNLIESTIHPELLQAWLKNEKRSGVVKKIEAQLKALTSPTVRRSDEPTDTEEVDEVVDND